MDVYDIINERAQNLSTKNLVEAPQSKERYPNRETRPIRHGHFVSTKPEALEKPFLIAYTKEMLENLGLSETHFESKEVVELFSGQNNKLSFSAWATPYAVSVNGNPIISPDNHGGYAYGDGRAMSLFQVPDIEVQLKGSGRTPFSRNFDGRAVLRSSIREFLVSELMHNFSVPTTRALTLVSSYSVGDSVGRAWYKESGGFERSERPFAFPPNAMIQERCAIASRASSSFFRIGHIELFSRRIRGGKEDEVGSAMEELETLVKHVIQRHYPNLGFQEKDQLTLEILLGWLREFADREAFMVCQWERVGFVQGNMNSDNMLLNGCTLDYGPFGFVEKFDPLLNPFTGDVQKNYGFLNQAQASHINFATLVDALMPLATTIFGLSARDRLISLIRDDYPTKLIQTRYEMRRSKFGLAQYDEVVEKTLFIPLLKFLNNFDYTMFWRILSSDLFDTKTMTRLSDVKIVEPLMPSSYGGYLENETNVKIVADWLRSWLNICQQQADSVAITLPDRVLMKKSNPKYIAREWMLVEAYTEATSLALTESTYDTLRAKIDPSLGQSENTTMTIKELWQNQSKVPFGKIYALQKLFQSPYAEHEEVEELFFKITPEEYQNKPGTTFYS